MGIRWRYWLLLGLVGLWLGLASWHSIKPLPDGLDFAGPFRADTQVEFLTDRTWVDADGQRRTDQQIFNRKLALINSAERLIVADQFLFNDFAGDPDGQDLRSLSSELAEALIARRQARPELRVIFITDPINTLYGGVESSQLEAMRDAGIEVVETRLERLRDSNPGWSGLWRLCCSWTGNSSRGGWLPNPVGEQKVGLRTWLRIANFKANHRKTLIVDQGDQWLGLVSSANPHDASSAHGNAAVLLAGQVALDLLKSERAIAAFSAPALPWPQIELPPSNGETIEAMVETTADLPQSRILTEAAIRDAVIQALAESGAGSRVDLAMFYLSHRGIIEALIDARRRGAAVRVLLDPNEHAFGREKNGVPNRPVAAELKRHDIAVRWCHTTGEQCHSKLILIRHEGGTAVMIAGSANYTRRNLDNFNPETAAEIAGSASTTALAQAGTWFDQRWFNSAGRSFSLDYTAYADERRWRYWQYRLMEATGLSTF